MQKLKISDDLSLPIEAATQTFAFIARKGAGKTYAAGKLTELLLDAGVQVVILDTVGNWYGLRLSADGKGKGFDVPVFGGLRGDLPLEAHGGNLVADVAVDTGRSLILDVSQFSLGDRKRFATAFGEQLWKRKKGEAHPSPLMLVIEESQLIVPQFTSRGGDEARMVGIYEEIIRLGRNYGIGCTMISQRPQSVNKEVLNQTECLFVLQVNGAQERKALKEWITHQGMDTNLVDELPSLPVGTAYVWSPQWLQILKKVKIAPKVTFDASSTPKVGQRATRRDPAPLDMAEISKQMSAVVERARESDPKLLKAKIAELQRDLARKPKEATPANAPAKTIERPVLKDGQLQRVDALLAKVMTIVTKAAEVQVGAKKLGDEISAALGRLNKPAPTVRPPATVAASVPRPHRGITTGPAADAHGRSALTPTERDVLDAAASFPGGATRQRISIFTGRSIKSSSFQSVFAGGESKGEKPSLVQRGLLTVSGDRYVPSEEGLALAQPTAGVSLDDWLRKLKPSEAKVLRFLADHPNERFTRAQVSEATGQSAKSSSFDGAFPALRELGLIEGQSDFAVAPSLLEGAD